MGLTIELQDERGGTIAHVIDVKNWLPPVLEPLQDDSHPFLDSIDLYGDTVFNRLQMRRFLSEWAEIIARADNPEGLILANGVQELAKRRESEVHLYVKFIGD